MNASGSPACWWGSSGTRPVDATEVYQSGGGGAGGGGIPADHSGYVQQCSFAATRLQCKCARTGAAQTGGFAVQDQPKEPRKYAELRGCSLSFQKPRGMGRTPRAKLSACGPYIKSPLAVAQTVILNAFLDRKVPAGRLRKCVSPFKRAVEIVLVLFRCRSLSSRIDGFEK